jgi:hypothetical protein
MATAWEIVKSDIRRLRPRAPNRETVADEAKAFAAVAVVASMALVAGIILSLPGAAVLWWFGVRGEQLAVGAALTAIPVIAALLYAHGVRERMKQP